MKTRLLLGVSVLALAAFAFHLNSAPSGSPGGTIAVPPGATAVQTVRRLSDEGLVRSPRWFRLLLRATGTDRRLRSGLYRVDPGLSAWGIVRRLRSGRGITVRVTVPEGWTAEKIAERLEAAGVCGRAAFLEEAFADEGFLFPDTYEFEPYLSAARVRDAMTARFEEAWRRAVAEAAPALRAVESSTVSARLDRVRLSDGRWWTAKEVVTLASIVERESGKGEERPLIAAVYVNRIKKGMRLEADPTVQYALGRWKERLLYRDLDVDSPYNTYRRSGLPPGPIGSPGLEAIKAALAPAQSPYLYFVAGEEGGHVFAVTYAEHLRNVRERNRRLRRAPPSR